MDPLIRNIRSKDQIEGLLVPTSQHELEEIKVLAYADDVTVICPNGVLQPIFYEYERLSKLSGLVLNADKTEIFNFCISQTRQNRIRYLDSTYKLRRVDKIKICGMTLASEDITEYQHNVLARIESMENIVTSWGKSHLTMYALS